MTSWSQGETKLGPVARLDTHQHDEILLSKTLAAPGLEEHVQVSLIFAIIISFMSFTVFTLASVLYFKEFPKTF